eukprot:COSAG06_NODE_28727_length_569_cov_0.951064_2_plen_61_part_01
MILLTRMRCGCGRTILLNSERNVEQYKALFDYCATTMRKLTQDTLMAQRASDELGELRMSP